MHDLVDDAGFQRAARRELPRGQDHLEGARQADKPRQALRAPCRGNESESRFREPDTRAGGVSYQSDIARERDLQPAAERRPVDRGDSRKGKCGKLVQHALHLAGRSLRIGRRCAAQQSEVSAGDELRLLPARDDQPARSCLSRGRDRRREIFEEHHVDRVYRVVGAIDDDPRDAGRVRGDEHDRRTAGGRDG